MKAKNASNQDAVDRINQLYIKASKNPNSKYGHTLKKAMKSVAECRNHISTRKEALELKGVGPKIAQLICPQLTTGNDKRKETKKKDSASSSRSSSSSSPANPGTNTSRARRPLPPPRTASTLSADDKNQLKTAPIKSPKQVAYEKVQQEAASLALPIGPWKVILVVDGREHKSEHVQAKLQMSGVPCQQRHLPIGDMAWIAKCGQVEIMLGTIIERKQVDDLASSLYGTRYLEQRLRLQQSGLPQLLLLVEGDTSNVINCPSETLHMCMMETRVHLDFNVIQTPHLDDTVKFLKNVHRRILQRTFPSAFSAEDGTAGIPSFVSPRQRPKKRRKKVSLVDLTFDSVPVPLPNTERFLTYEELKAKVEWDRERGTRTVGAVHLAMLKQIPSLSHKKVQALGQAYSTPSAIMQAYEGLEPEDGLSLVQEFSTSEDGARECRVGPKSAAEVYHVCTQGASSSIARTISATAQASKQPIENTSKLQKKASPRPQPKEAPAVAQLPDTAPEDRPFAAAWSSDSDSSPDTIARRCPPTVRETAVASSIATLVTRNESVTRVVDSSPESDTYQSNFQWDSSQSPPRKPAARASPTSPIQERRMEWKRQALESSDDDDDYGDHELEIVDSLNEKKFAVATVAAVGKSTLTSSQASSSEASNPNLSLSQSSREEEPLWVRCQRMAQNPRHKGAAPKSQGAPSSLEVIEID